MWYTASMADANKLASSRNYFTNREIFKICIIVKYMRIQERGHTIICGYSLPHSLFRSIMNPLYR
jgi:hypothetical protein